MNIYFEWGGDHTRAAMIHKILPETRKFRSVSSFRDPLVRTSSLYAYMSQVANVQTSLAGFDKWIREVFCNPHNEVWRAHGLQVGTFTDQLGTPCVDRVYAIERLNDMVDFLVPGSAVDLPHLNNSNLGYSAHDLSASTQRLLLNALERDLEFHDRLRSADGLLIYA